MRSGILKKPVGGFRFGHDDGTEDDPMKVGYIRPLMVVVFRNAEEHAGRGDPPPKAEDALPSNSNGDEERHHGQDSDQQKNVSEEKATNITGLRILSKVSPKPVEWLWDGYIALGELTILEGHPDTNKSSLTIDIAARLTRGRKMPCVPATGSRPLKGGVLILVGEDSVEKTVVARLKAAGADLDRVAVLENVAIPDDVLAIEKAIVARGVKLLIIDTLSDFLNCNVLSNQQVRRALRKLRKLAEKMNIAVVLLRHFVKSLAVAPCSVAAAAWRSRPWRGRS